MFRFANNLRQWFGHGPGFVLVLAGFALTSGCCLFQKKTQVVRTEEDPLAVHLRELQSSIQALEPAVQAFLVENNRLTEQRQWAALFDIAIRQAGEEIQEKAADKLKDAALKWIERDLVERFGPDAARSLLRGAAAAAAVDLDFKLALMKAKFDSVLERRAELPLLAHQRELILHSIETMLTAAKEARLAAENVKQLEQQQPVWTARVQALLAICRQQAAGLEELINLNPLAAPAASR